MPLVLYGSHLRTFQFPSPYFTSNSKEPKKCKFFERIPKKHWICINKISSKRTIRLEGSKTLSIPRESLSYIKAHDDAWNDTAKRNEIHWSSWKCHRSLLSRAGSHSGRKFFSNILRYSYYASICKRQKTKILGNSKTDFFLNLYFKKLLLLWAIFMTFTLNLWPIQCFKFTYFLHSCIIKMS